MSLESSSNSGLLGQPAAGAFAKDARHRDAENQTNSILSWWKRVWSMPGKTGTFLGWPATVFILIQLAIGLPLLPYALLHWRSDDPLRFACFLGVALGASLFKVRLPGI